MTLLPRSLFGRLVLTFVGVMALTVSVTMAVQMSEREAFVFRVSSEGAAHWLADQLKLLDRLPGLSLVVTSRIALRLHDVGMVKSSPQKLIAQGTDWRFLNELRKELKA